MTTRDLFLLVLAGLYVSDLWWLLPHRSFVFRGYRQPLRWVSAARSGFSLGRGRSLVMFTELPFGLSFATDFPALTDGVLRTWPLFAGDEGGVTEQAVPGPLEADGDRIRVEGRVVVRFSSAVAARRALADEPGAADVRTIVEEFAAASLPLRAVSTALFAFLIGGLPAVLYGAVSVHWSWLLAVYGLLVFAIQFLFFKLHRRAYPEAAAERWAKMLVMIVSPPEAMVASHTLSRGLLAGHHPLVVAHALCSDQDFLRLAELLLRGALLAPAEAQESLRHTVEAFRVDPSSLLNPPERDGESRAYCPRCLAQFDPMPEVCPDCPSVAVRAF
ncbi:MAG: hypothetical protein AAFX94_06660 [Myxococcota bacterium]